LNIGYEDRTFARVNVLLIEDCQQDAEIFRRKIRAQSDTGVELAASLQEAQARASECFDVIVSDLNLHDGHGVDLVRQLRGLFRGTPIVILSGADDEEIAKQSLRHGAHDFVNKTAATPALLAKTIAFAIERGRHEREYARDLLEITAAHEEIAGRQADMDRLLSVICARTLRLVPATGVAVEMPEYDHLVYRGAAGVATTAMGLRVKMDASLSGLCFRTNTLLQSDDTEIDARVDQEACRSVHVRSMVVVPLEAHGLVVGVLKAYSSSPYAFSPLDVERLRVLSKVTGGLLAQAILYAEKERVTAEFEQALQEVKRLSGLIPICASCKKIRDDEGSWNQLEKYICEHSDAQFSHGICPTCADALYGEILAERRVPCHTAQFNSQ
jgi:DNA-binding NarL/FixJ family response regulator